MEAMALYPLPRSMRLNYLLRRLPAFAVTLAALCLSAPVLADSHHDTGFLNRRLVIGSVIWRYQIYVPEEWTSHGKWPVILFLHGSGERGSDGMDQTQVGLPAAIRAHPERWPFLVVMPQLPYGHRRWTDPDMMAVAMATLDSEMKEFHGDPQRVYLTGISMGGYGVWEIARTHPRRFAAVAPVCGGIFWPYAPERWRQPGLAESYARALGRTPVWMFHGLDDPIVVPRQSEAMFEALKASGGDVRLWEYAGWQHNVWEKAYTEPDLPLWFLRHRLADTAGNPVFAERITVPLHPVPVRLNPAVYEAYLGDYYDAGTLQATILRQGDGLAAKDRYGQTTEILPESATSFFYPHGGSTRLIFEKDARGEVKGILYRDDRHEEHWEKRR